MQPPSAPQAEGVGISTPTASSSVGDSQLPYVREGDSGAIGFNVFRSHFSKIEKDDQLHFMFRGFVRDCLVCLVCLVLSED